MDTELPIEDVPLPPGYPVPPGYRFPPWSTASQHENQQLQLAGYDNDFDEDEDEEDGGVEAMDFEAAEPPLDLELDDPTPVRPTHSSNDTQEMKRKYHQIPFSELPDTGNLWRLPVTPVYGSKKFSKIGITHMIEVIYHRSCRLIWKHWRREPTKCLPIDLRNNTLYSLTMLLHLRRLASHTKGNFTRAQSELLEARNERLWRRGMDATHTCLEIEEIENSSARSLEKQLQENLEPRVQESVFGLRVVDVLKALEQVTSSRKRARRIARQNALVGQGPQHARQVATNQTKIKEMRAEAKLKRTERLRAEIAERVAHQRQMDNQATSTKLDSGGWQATIHCQGAQDPEGGVSLGITAPPSSPKAKKITFGFTDEQLEQILRGPNLNGNHQMTNENAGPQSTRSRDEIEGTKRLTHHLNTMGMKRHRPMKPYRHELFRKGGFSRRHRTSDETRMPSERLDLNAMPTLHDLASTSAADLARLGQQSLPG